MKYTKNEIFNALNLIQDICIAQHDFCDSCPLSDNNNECIVRDYTPEGWSLRDPNTEMQWKAFTEGHINNVLTDFGR